MLLVELTPRALAHLRQASQSWYQNRPAAPFAVEDDFEAGANLLARNPEIGSRSASVRYPELRKLFLERIGYLIYYLRPGKVVVLAVWHASRQAPPAL